MANGVVYCNKSYKLSHSRTIATHWRPIHGLDDLRERFGKRFLRYLRAVDLDSFGTGQKVRSGERTYLHRYASSVMVSLQKRRDEAASASFSLGAGHVDHIETAQDLLLCRGEPGVSSDIDGSWNALYSPVARGYP
jgi:hypothetical protein